MQRLKKSYDHILPAFNPELYDPGYDPGYDHKIKFHIINKNFHSQNQDHLIVHFTRNGRVNKTNFYHMQVLLQFPKGNDFKTELRRANSCIRSLRASDGQNGPNFFGTLVKCGNNELSRFTIQFF